MVLQDVQQGVEARVTVALAVMDEQGERGLGEGSKEADGEIGLTIRKASGMATDVGGKRTRKVS